MPEWLARFFCWTGGHEWHLNAVRADRLIYVCDWCGSHKDQLDFGVRKRVMTNMFNKDHE